MKIICVANSYKHHGRCIAGINLQSGVWIRPVSTVDGGKIPVDNTRINVSRIWLLDVVDIPINPKQKLGYEIENYGYENGFWQVVGKGKITDLLPYCEDNILYPECDRSIPYSYLLQQSPLRTLQLIEVKSLHCYRNDHDKPKARILDEKYGISDIELSITDPVTLKRLDYQESFTCHGLVCLSFSQPWQKDSSEELKCYRLVAGVIEIFPELEMILTQMQRVGWSYDRGRQYLRDKFKKQSRYQLTQEEALEFLQYLENFPDSIS